MMWSWDYVAAFIERDFGDYVDWDEKVFYCPECGEPIYKCDYPYLDIGMICPVCEFVVEEE